MSSWCIYLHEDIRNTKLDIPVSKSSSPDLEMLQNSPLRKKFPYWELFWSVLFPDFPAFGLNTERYCVSVRIQSECRKIREKYRPEYLRIRTLFTQ